MAADRAQALLRSGHALGENFKSARLGGEILIDPLRFGFGETNLQRVRVDLKGPGSLIRNLAPGVDGLLQTTAESGRYFLAVAEQGAILEDGSTSPRRRAFYGLIELQEANADGVELFRRCVSWVLGEL